MTRWTAPEGYLMLTLVFYLSHLSSTDFQPRAQSFQRKPTACWYLEIKGHGLTYQCGYHQVSTLANPVKFCIVGPREVSCVAKSRHSTPVSHPLLLQNVFFQAVQSLPLCFFPFHFSWFSQGWFALLHLSLSTCPRLCPSRRFFSIN